MLEGNWEEDKEVVIQKKRMKVEASRGGQRTQEVRRERARE